MKCRKLLASAASLIVAGGLITTPAMAGGKIGYGAHYGSGHSGYSLSYGHRFGGRGYRGGYRGGHHGGSGLAIAVPLALFAGYLFANSSRPRERVVSYPAPAPAPSENVWIEQPAPASASTEYCREYTTEIMINGEAQEAYGQACRQEDGSWKIMTQNLVPDFD